MPIKLATGADVLVHDALFPAGVDRLVAGVANAATLKQSILSHHTSAEDAGRVAKKAGVKTLVLSHFVPPEVRRSPIACGSRPQARTSMGRSSLVKTSSSYRLG